MPATRKNLPDGITLIDVNGNKYTVVGDPIGFGGSSIIYRVRKNNDTEALYALKEIYPVDDISYSFFRQEDNRVVGVNAGSELKLQEYRDSLTEEKQKGDSIGHNNPTVLTISDILDMNIERDLEKISLGQYALMRDITGAKTIQQILEECKENDRLYYTDEREKKPKAYTVIRIIESILMALEKVHNNGYIHGDIQPNNIVYLSADPQNNIWGAAMLLDFGSARKISEHKIGDAIYLTTEDLRGQNIYSTDGYRAPEIRSNAEIRLSPQTDIYSVGKLMNYLLNGCSTIGDFTIQANTPGARRSGYGDSGKKIEEIYKKATKNDWKKRYASASEMLAEVHALCLELQPSAYKFRNAVPSSEYKGRDKEIADIGKLFNTRNMLFLCGFGGIGKTTLAILYGQKYARKNGYEVIYTAFNNSIKETIAGLNLTGYNDQGLELQYIDTRYSDKMSELRKLPSDSTLLIIDNMFSDFKTFNEIRKEAEYLDLEQCGIKILITTRYKIEQENGGYEVKLFTTEKLLEIMGNITHSCDVELNGKEREDYLELIRCAQSNTYIVTLMAKTMVAGNISAMDIINRIHKNQLFDDRYPRIEDDKTYQDNDLSSLVTELFRIDNLTTNENVRKVMQHTLLIPEKGIRRDVFLECEKAEGLLDEVNALVNRSYIIFDEEHKTYRIHQIMRMAICKEIKFSPNEYIVFIRNLSVYLHNNSEFTPDYAECYEKAALLIGKDGPYARIIMHTINGLYLWANKKNNEVLSFFRLDIVKLMKLIEEKGDLKFFINIWLQINEIRTQIIEIIEDVCADELGKVFSKTVYSIFKESNLCKEKQYSYYADYGTYEDHLVAEHNACPWGDQFVPEEYDMDAQLFFTYYRSTYWNPLDWILNRRYIYVIDQYIENTEITKDIASIEKYSNIICESLESIKKATQDMNCLAMLKNWVHLSYLAGTITKNNYIADEKLEENIQNLIQNKKLISPNLRSTTFKMCNKSQNNEQNWQRLNEILLLEGKICAYVVYPAMRGLITNVSSVIESKNILLSAGDIFLHNGKFNESELCLRKAVLFVEDSDDISYYEELVSIYKDAVWTIKNNQILFDIYDLIRKQIDDGDRETEVTYVSMARWYKKSGEKGKAVLYYEKYLHEYSNRNGAFPQLEEIQAMEELCALYVGARDYQNAKKYLKYLTSYIKETDVMRVWKCYEWEAEIEIREHNWSRALVLYKKALREYRTTNYWRGEEKHLYERLGKCSCKLENYEETIKYYDEAAINLAWQYDKISGDAVRTLKDAILIARECHKRGNLEYSLQYYSELMSFKWSEDVLYQCRIYIRTAQMYKGFGFPEKEKYYYEKGLALALKQYKIDNASMELIRLIESCYKGLQNYNQLRKYYDIEIESVEKSNQWIQSTSRNVVLEAICYFHAEKQFEISLEYCMKALELFGNRESAFTVDIVEIYVPMISCYIELKEYNEALTRIEIILYTDIISDNSICESRELNIIEEWMNTIIDNVFITRCYSALLYLGVCFCEVGGILQGRTWLEKAVESSIMYMKEKNITLKKPNFEIIQSKEQLKEMCVWLSQEYKKGADSILHFEITKINNGDENARTWIINAYGRAHYLLQYGLSSEKLCLNENEDILIHYDLDVAQTYMTLRAIEAAGESCLEIIQLAEGKERKYSKELSQAYRRLYVLSTWGYDENAQLYLKKREEMDELSGKES